MKEQVIAQKVGDRAGLYEKRRSGAIAQRPTKRVVSLSFGERLRSMAGYLPLVARIVLAIVAAVLIFTGYRAAASASFFQVRMVDVGGTARASTTQIQSVVRREAGQTGVWRADLVALSKQLERLPWVRTAVVSRLLPDGLRVRITERMPRAVVRTTAGRFVWVDEDAVTLAEMSPTDQVPAFFLRGWGEEENPEVRNENRERVQTYLRLLREWDASGLSARVSELNLADLRDVRAQLAGEDSQIEIRLGADDLGLRLGRALKVLDEQRNTPLGPFITYIIMSQKNPIVGHSVGTHATDVVTKASTKGVSEAAKTRKQDRASIKPQSYPQTAKSDSKQAAPKREQTGESRKRRVGEPRKPNDR